MFYRNTLKSVKKVKYKNLKLNFDGNFDCDNEHINVNFPKYCINFDTTGNQLSNCYGESKFYCCYNQNGDAIAYPEIGDIGMLKHLKYFVKVGEGISQKQMVVEDINSNVFYSVLDDGIDTKYELVTLDAGCDSKYFTCYYNQNNYLLISTKTDESSKLYIYDGSVVRTNLDMPFIHDICMHNEYLFLSLEEGERNSVYFCDDNNPLNIPFNIGNLKSIGLPTEMGKIQKLLSYNDYLYVICEYGIARITFYKNQDEFSVEEIYIGTSKIIEGSIVKGGDDIIFSDIEGIYILSGNSVKKIDLKCYSLFNETYKFQGIGCYDNGKYYLATRLGNYKDGIIDSYDNQKNNALIVYDTIKNKLSVCFDISIKDMDVYYDKSQSRVAVLAGNNRNYYLRTLIKNGIYNTLYPSKKLYMSHEFDCGNSDTKIIRNIKISTKEAIDLTLNYDNKKCNYHIDGCDDIQKIIVNKKAVKFAISINSNTLNPLIKSCEILVGIYE